MAKAADRVRAPPADVTGIAMIAATARKLAAAAAPLIERTVASR
jgi:hypothetical protein